MGSRMQGQSRLIYFGLDQAGTTGFKTEAFVYLPGHSG